MLFKKGRDKHAARNLGADREKERLKALEYLALSMDASWPLSIVLSPHSMLVYQFYFKHLTLCKVCSLCADMDLGVLVAFTYVDRGLCCAAQAPSARTCWSSALTHHQAMWHAERGVCACAAMVQLAAPEAFRPCA